MIFRPIQQKKITYFYAFSFLVGGVAILLCAPLAHHPAVPQFLGIALCTVGLFLLNRYALTSFVYQTEDGVLSVHKQIGNKSTAVCRLPLGSCDAFTVSTQAQKGERFPGGKYSYRVNLRPQAVYYLSFRDGEERIRLTLEFTPEAAQRIVPLLPPDAYIAL